MLLEGGADGCAGIGVSGERRNATGGAFTSSSTPVTKSGGIEMRKETRTPVFIRHKSTGCKVAGRASASG